MNVHDIVAMSGKGVGDDFIVIGSLSDSMVLTNRQGYVIYVEEAAKKFFTKTGSVKSVKEFVTAYNLRYDRKIL